MEAIVLAGGRGTRLRDVVADLPKPLAPVRNRPFLAYLMAYLESSGITRVCLSTGYMGYKIRDAIGSRFGSIDVVYSQETEPLGTGGAIAKAMQSMRQEIVFAMNGDTYAELDLRSMASQHRERGSYLTNALVCVGDATRYGRTEVRDGQVVSFHEKGVGGPALINAGCYLLNRKAIDFAELPESFSFEERVLSPLAAKGLVAAFLSSGYFLDIGIPSDYARAASELRSLP
jgi:D-glycero-alpha-D-manno-heptose 1-phosphate guanylyltransferase